MNILITVGTTSFDGLVKAVDGYAGIDNLNSYIFQIGKGICVPVNGEYFKYSDEIECYYNDSDVIITHAGAGTIYRLLELRKIIIAVPNMERVDKHQSDIAKFMEQNRHLLVCWNLQEIHHVISKVNLLSPQEYIKEPFFKFNEISCFIKS